ncbi:anthranilate synthase component I family protein [Rummeliibacillus sp. NPDC094406]|uniref:anthranilate synthase component I family protein n=1 Tax=Rummeliibacillus sp. NPDC094406 TaxID=3364511 RepID=UPI0037FC6239
MQLVKSESFSMQKDVFFNSYKKQIENETHSVFLESGRGGTKTIAAWNPLAVVQSIENGLQIDWRDGKREQHIGEPLHLIEKLLLQYKIDAPSDSFYGGAIGFITYDYVRQIEVIPNIAEDDLHVPDIYFYIMDCWTVLDVENEKATVMKLSTSDVDVEELANSWQTERSKSCFDDTTAQKVKNDDSRIVSMTNEQFKDAVEQIQHYIAQGDVFQVNLSVRQAKKLDVEPLIMYEALRTFNPSPYMAYINSPNFAIVSGSPELLIQKYGEDLSTRPIAGTRPRGKNDAEDLALANELINHEKERAEHVMLVDLERNDLGRVSEYGTVHVDEFMVIEKYSHVMHIVSNVRGKVAKGQSNTDIIRAVFPGGTITGAPKIRTMEIIEELEPVRRGLYTGSIGWIGFNGDIELNIVIRTAFIKNGVAYIQAGAGVVIDSVPEREYIESLNKAKALWQAKTMAEGVNAL